MPRLDNLHSEAQETDHVGVSRGSLYHRPVYDRSGGRRALRTYEPDCDSEASSLRLLPRAVAEDEGYHRCRDCYPDS